MNLATSRDGESASIGFVSGAARRARRTLRNWRIRSALADTNRCPAILCASIGRVGSNMLHRSIVEARTRSILGSFEAADAALVGATNWNLAERPLASGRVIKTHDFPYALDRGAAVKVVFSLGRPSDTVLSVLRKSQVSGESWRDRHLLNMHACGPLEEALDRDVLRLEEQIDSWTAVSGVPLMAIHYDALWTSEPLLSDFLGFRVTLPERRARHFDDLDPALVARVRNAYARVDEKVAGLPLVWRANG